MGVKHLEYSHSDRLAEFRSESTYDTVFRAVRKYGPAGTRILDVGSGRGELLKRFSEAGYAAHGCDMDEECVRLSSRYAPAQKLAIEEVTQENFDSGFDCIVLSHVLEHLENPRQTLLQLSSLTTGVMVVSIPNLHYAPWVVRSLLRMNLDYVNEGHLQGWDWAHFKNLVENGCGKEVLEWFYDSVSVPFPEGFKKSLHKIGALDSIDNGILRATLPRFSRSITAVIKA